MSKKKLTMWIIIAAIAVVVLALALVFGLKGCVGEPAGPTTPVETTAPTEPTAPEEEETEEPTEEEIIIEAGVMGMHPNGKNGDLGIYFTMEENDIPFDASWATEFRPRSLDAIQLIRDGETYSIGNTMTGMIIKYSPTEYYLKLEEWNIKQYFPITNGDILKVEGNFGNSELEVTFRIETSYIKVEEGLVFFSTEYPTGSNINSVYAGVMDSHPNGMVDSGIYFTMAPNGVPVDSSWATEYKPVTEDAIQLIRDGHTYNIGNTAAGMLIKYSDTEYFLKLEQWIIKDLYPIRDGDIIKVSGKFANTGTATVVTISTSYIACAEGLLFFSEEFPEDIQVEVIETGVMGSHPNGRDGEKGLYFTMAENAIPVPEDDPWAVEYAAASADCIKLIRDGKTYSIANTAAGQIIKYSATEYYLKLDQWLIKDYFPIKDGDILVVEGKFSNTGTATVFNVAKSYISFAGGLLFFSDKYPEKVEVEVIKTSVMGSHPNGRDGEKGLYFTMAENAISVPEDDPWAVEYKAANADCIKLIRDGKTYSIANPEAGQIIKYSDTEYYLKLDQWIIKDYFPITDGDILVVEGQFSNTGVATVFNVKKSYISFAGGLLFFSDKYPEDVKVEVVEAGVMSSHEKGREGEKGLYFTMAENAIPVPEDDPWAVEYKPASADCIKLIRDGKTYSIANPEAGQIIKFSDTEYFLKLDQWIIKDYFPITDGDILVVEGQFSNTGTATVFHVSKSYISFAAGLLFFSDKYPEDVKVEVIETSVMGTHANGRDGQKGLYFTMAENAIPVPEDPWSVEYKPASADCIKLIRDGKTYSIANPEAGQIIKFSATDYYLKLDQWIIKEYFPITDGDVLVVEGQFSNTGTATVFHVKKSYISYSGGLVFFSDKYPEDVKVEVIQAGRMSGHSKDMNGKTGIYFTMKKNAIPVPDDAWSVEYAAANADCIKLIRDGKTYSIANPEAGQIIKYSATEYYLKLDQWIIKDCFPITDGDILVVEGQFANSGTATVFNISKTYISIESAFAFFSKDYPSGGSNINKVEAGNLREHPNGWSTEMIYGTMDANNAPFESDWTLRYTPASTDVIKLIRDGQVHNVANTGAEMLVKYGETDYCLITEKWILGDYYPLRHGDVLVIDGVFKHGDSKTALIIDKTVLTVEDDQLLFSTEDPAEIPGGHMTAHYVNGWDHNSNKGLYFSLAENAVPVPEQDAWAVEYAPTSLPAIKLVRNGKTYNIAKPGMGTIVKYGNQDYYLKLDDYLLDKYAPIKVGDKLIVEGQFLNADSGVYFRISKTTVSIGKNYKLTFTEGEATEPEVLQAGAMSSHKDGWSITRNRLSFTLAENTLAQGSDRTYSPTLKRTIQLFRDGQMIRIGVPEMVITKTGETAYTLTTSKAVLGDLYPIKAGDILVVEGVFADYNGGFDPYYGTYFAIDKTYILVGEDYATTFTQDDPFVVAVENVGGHENGWSSKSIYFTATENTLPFDGWSVEYTPAAAENLKLVRDGQTYHIGIPGRGTIVKYSGTEYMLKIEGWTVGDYAPLVKGDTLILDGDFVNEAYGFTMRFDGLELKVGTNGVLYINGVPTTEEPEPTEPTEPTQPGEGVIQGGTVGIHPNGWSSNASAAGGLYFTLVSNEASYVTGWTTRFNPTSNTVVKLVRDGNTYNVANVDAEMLCKYGDTDYYLEFWPISYKPLKAGDKLIIEGSFINSANGQELYIDHSEITLNAGGSVSLDSSSGEQEPTEPDDGVIQGGIMGSHTNGWTASGGLYFTLEANEAAYESGWSTRFKPASSAVVKLVRDGNTYDVANVDAEMLCKFGDTDYYLEFWPITYKPLKAGDVLIVEGSFINEANGQELYISRSQVTLNADGTATFPEAEEQPTEPEPTEPETTQPNEGVIQGGVMGSHSNGWTASGGLHFTLKSNDASFVTDWSTRFKPTSGAAIKLVRDGNTYDVANVDAEMLCKFGDTDYYLEFWPITYKPLKAGDVLIVEGSFINEANGQELYISRSQVTLNAGGTATFPEAEEQPTEPETTQPETTEPETTEPETTVPAEPGVIQAGQMGAHNSGLTSTMLYFTMTANDVPYHVTKAMYKPTSADAIQLVRDGVTYDIADVEAYTVYKYGSTNYKLKLASLTMAPQDGDLLIFSGTFTGGNTNTPDTVVTFRISSTYYSIADGEATLYTTDPRAWSTKLDKTPWRRSEE